MFTADRHPMLSIWVQYGSQVSSVGVLLDVIMISLLGSEDFVPFLLM